MKANKLHQSICFVALFLMFICGQAKAQSSEQRISLSVTTGNKSYLPGELVDVRFQIRNLAKEPLTIAKPSVAGGNLKLFISEDGKTFREYFGPGWGLRSSPFQPQVNLEADGICAVKATLLYNHRFATEHLTELYARAIREKHIDSEYALPHSGSYWLKAIFTDEKTATESEPIELIIAEPLELDSVVWQSIKDDGAMAYFLHTGVLKQAPGTREADEFILNLRQLIDLYPRSLYTEKLSSLLAQYDARKDAMQK